jgi:N-acetyl-beta-hexosaminidase
MKHKFFLSSLIVLTLCSCSSRQAVFTDVIPAPQSIESCEGVYSHKPWSRIKTSFDATMAPESYILEIGRKGASVVAADEAGLFYARQTLSQALGIGTDRIGREFWKADCCRIEDGPRFAYRGLLMDVSRHFRSKDFVLKHIDAMAAVKLNRLHMHLTDGGGWRLQVDSYPRLNEIGAYRTGKNYMALWKPCEPSDSAYGGFYTKDEIREIVEYAAARHITVVPEIEIPGHSDEVLAAYPELRCYEGSTTGDLCPGKEATFEMMFRILDEVIDLFPSEYIHIGGDEAAKKSWKDCPDCNRRMQEEHLASLDELQSYTIKRVEEYVESKGRHIIGWDEILEGGLAPSATVMSWRGIEGGEAAIAAGHKAIMTPGKYCYIDATQDYPNNEPPGFGNYLPFDMVYSYDPIVELTDPSLLLGVQANLWGEMIPEDSNAEYMYWPRSLALAEVAWTRPERKNLKDARRRAILRSKAMREQGYNVFDLEKEVGERPEALQKQNHLAVGAKVTMLNGCKWNSSFSAGGPDALADGICGGWTYQDGKWQGYLCDVDVLLDLGEEKEVSTVSILSMQNRVAAVFLPEYVEVLLSADGKEFTSLGKRGHDVPGDYYGARFQQFSFGEEGHPQKARYIRMTAPKQSMGGFIFLDEILVR